MNTALFAYRNYLNLLYNVSPDLATKRAFRLFATPMGPKPKPQEYEALAQAQADTVTVNGQPLTRYRWGHEDSTAAKPKALLVHGWGGNGGSLGYYVQPLLNLGYEVVSFDGPAHHTSPQKHTNLFDYSRVVYHFIHTENAETVVAHSFGCAASVMALHDHADAHSVKRLVLMGTPDRLTDIVSDFTTQMRFNDRKRIRLFNYLSNRFHRSIYSVSLSEYLRYARVPHVLVIHDYADRIVPHSNAEAVRRKVPEARLMTIEKVGHYKMLWHEPVKQRVLEFINTTK